MQSSFPFMSAGFRPMFLLATIWAAASLGLWILMISGTVSWDMPWSQLDWHVHELLFGFGNTVLCGFLLTAIPNWTGRTPISGAPLGGLIVAWALGRWAVTYDIGAGPVFLATQDLLFPLLFTLLAAREVFAASNRRNYVVIGLVAAFLLANGVFHIEAAREGTASFGYGVRAGLALILMMLSLIGGRIIPAFTRNWMNARSLSPAPQQFSKFDAATLVTSGATMAIWTVAPDQPVTGAALLVTAAMQLLRLSRWRMFAVRPEPMLMMLHVAYAFIPLGFLLVGLATFLPEIPITAGLHAWTAGAIGTMTLTVMTRASLGHSGLPLMSGWAERIFLTSLPIAALLRIAATVLTDAPALLHLSAAFWILGFGLFAVRFAPIMFAPRAK